VGLRTELIRNWALGSISFYSTAVGFALDLCIYTIDILWLMTGHA